MTKHFSRQSVVHSSNENSDFAFCWLDGSILDLACVIGCWSFKETMPKALRKASRLQPNKEVSVIGLDEDAAIVLRKGISETGPFADRPRLLLLACFLSRKCLKPVANL